MPSNLFWNLKRALGLACRWAQRSRMDPGPSPSPEGGRHHVKALRYLLLPATAALPMIFFLYDLDAYPLRDNNEGLYAEIAREMLDTGNFIVPHLLGVPYIEKPPLLYWLMALSFHFFGESEASARLVSALPMTCMAIALYVFCRGLGYRRVGFLAAVIVSTSLPVAVLSRTVLFDPLLTALLGASLLAFQQWYLMRRRAWIRVAAVLLALATLEKGGVALVLVGGIIGTFLCLLRDFRTLLLLGDRVAISLFFLVVAPWHILATLRQDGFAWFYFVNEHLLRFLGLREPNDYHLGPIYYYLPRVLVLLFPWTPFLCLLLRPSREVNPVESVLIRFCQAWVLFPLLFFSLSQAKGTYYVLVITPACALWLGIVLAYRVEKKLLRTLSYCLGSAMAVCVAGLWALLFFDRLLRPSPTSALLLILGAIGVAGAWRVGSCLIFMARSNSWRDAALATVGVAAMPLLIIIVQTANTRFPHASSRQVAETINRHSSVQPMVFVYQDFEDVFSSLPFYLGHSVKVIDSRSRDLQFGCRTSSMADNACISLSEFDAYHAHLPVAVAVHQNRLGSWPEAIGSSHWRSERAGDKWVFFNY
jgi:4-amino-4-deoxy-L-arabinose transferase-like glycosyltransferase